MAPGSCVHASSWAIDSSVDPENFHQDDLQKCLSTSSFQGCTAFQRWPQVLVSMKVPGLLILQWMLRTFIRTQPRQQHSLLGSAVSPILEGSSVCCQTKAGGISLSQKGSWFTLIHFLRM